LVRFISEHSLLCTPAPSTLLASNTFPARPLLGDNTRLQCFNFVQQQAPRNKPVKALLSGRLALYVDTRGCVHQYNAGRGFIHVLAPVSTGPNKTLS